MRKSQLLTAKEVDRIAKTKGSGQYVVGCNCTGSLLLQVVVKSDGNRSASWLYRCIRDGKATKIGLGAYSNKSGTPGALTEARKRAEEAARDPDAYKARRNPVRSSTHTESKTCKVLFPRWIEYQRDRRAWNTEKDFHNYQAILTKYAAPLIGDLEPNEITIDHLVAILTPIINAGKGGKGRTSDKTRSALRAFFDWCMDVDKSRAQELGNPASDGRRLNRLLPTIAPRPTSHYPACQLSDLPRLVKLLTEKERFMRPSAMAFLFMILTCSRHANIARQEKSAIDSFAVWQDIDLENAVWIIPAHKMKTSANGRHVVPLSSAALAILRRLEALGLRDDDAPVFHNGSGQAFSNAVFQRWIMRLSEEDKAHGGRGFIDPNQGNRLITPHGTSRAAFMTWVVETGEDRTLAEICLHHIQDKYRGAYMRAEAVERRRALLERWSAFCLSECDPTWSDIP